MCRIRSVLAELVTPVLVFGLFLGPFINSRTLGEYQAGCGCCTYDTIPGSETVGCSGSCPDCQTADDVRSRSRCIEAPPGFSGQTECYMESNRIGSRQSCELVYNEEEYEDCLWWTLLYTIECVACLVATIAGSGGTVTILCAGVCSVGMIATAEDSCSHCEVKECAADPSTERDIMRDELTRGGGVTITCGGG